MRINLGAGDAELLPPQGLRLDDLFWHDVTFKSDGGDLTLTVDGIHQTE